MTPDTPADAPADPHEAQTLRCCEAETPRGEHKHPFLCTLPRNHDGPHVATGPGGGHIFATWSGMDPELEAAALEGIADNPTAQAYAAGYQAGQRDANQRHLRETADLASVIAELRGQLAAQGSGVPVRLSPPELADLATCGNEREGRVCRLAPGHSVPHTDFADEWKTPS